MIEGLQQLVRYTRELEIVGDVAARVPEYQRTTHIGDTVGYTVSDTLAVLLLWRGELRVVHVRHPFSVSVDADCVKRRGARW